MSKLEPQNPVRTKKRPAVHVRIDWREYFLGFCDMHGGDPVIHDGKLLFRDGWSHSSTDYRGPEWPPPATEVERDSLIKTYWEKRLPLVKAERDRVKFMYEQLEAARQSRSAPLVRTMVVVDEEGRLRRATADVDFDMLEKDLQYAEEDVVECEAQLKAFETLRKLGI